MSVSKGEKVSFFNGRKPMLGVVEEVQDDGSIVVKVNSGEGTMRIIKEADEVMPIQLLKGARSNIKFVSNA